MSIEGNWPKKKKHPIGKGGEKFQPDSRGFGGKERGTNHQMLTRKQRTKARVIKTKPIPGVARCPP